MTHAELVSQFAFAQDHDQWMIWTEPCLGVRLGDTCHPDVLMIRKSWANYEVRILEIKVKQSDLDQDVKKLKFEKYYPWCDRISFVLGPGLKEDILLPHSVGIIKSTAKGFHTKRSAPRLTGENKLNRSFELFHALNMNSKRIRQNDRLNSIREAKQWLELANHKSEYNELHKVRSRAMKDLIENAKYAENSPEKLEQKAQEKFNKSLRELLELKSWDYVSTAREAIESVVSKHTKELSKNIDDDLEKLFKKAGESK